MLSPEFSTRCHAADLLDGFSESDPPTCISLSKTTKFEFFGVPIAPHAINTLQFGEQWGNCRSTHPINIPSSTGCNTMAKFMSICEIAGLHKVEEIAATNEGIAACVVGDGSMVALIHGKIFNLPGGISSHVSVTVKSTDMQLGLTLSIYLKKMMS